MRNIGICTAGPSYLGSYLPRIGRRASVACLALIVFGWSASPAGADPVRIVLSGFAYQLVDDGETGIAFSGDGFGISGAEVSRVGVQVCGPCVPGTTLDLSSTLFFNAFPPGAAFVDGNFSDTVFFGGSLDIVAGSVIVPNVPIGGPYPRPEAPFRFTGTLLGFNDVTRTGAPLFTLQLAGGGTTSLGFFNYPTSPGIFTDGFSYAFDHPEPTPEPGSLLLFGTGAALVARRWCRRQ
jgi:PEP-CTERM motif